MVSCPFVSDANSPLELRQRPRPERCHDESSDTPSARANGQPLAPRQDENKSLHPNIKKEGKKDRETEREKRRQTERKMDRSIEEREKDGYKD